MTLVTHWIDNGPVVVDEKARQLPILSPADGSLISYCPLADATLVERCIESSQKAFTLWRYVT